MAGWLKLWVMNKERPTTLYHIRLRDRLDPELATWFSELACAPEAAGGSLLYGRLPDQAALLGILFRIHNLNLHILAVNVGESDNV